MAHLQYDQDPVALLDIVWGELDLPEQQHQEHTLLSLQSCILKCYLAVG